MINWMIKIPYSFKCNLKLRNYPLSTAHRIAFPGTGDCICSTGVKPN